MPEIVMTRTEYPNSISIGRETRGGVLKIYMNASDLAECQKRIDNMVSARAYLLQKLGGALD